MEEEKIRVADGIKDVFLVSFFGHDIISLSYPLVQDSRRKDDSGNF